MCKFGKDGSIFRKPFSESARGEFLQIVQLYKKLKLKSRSLTLKDEAIFSLTARALENV